MLRRASLCIALIGALALGVTGVASAAPTITLVSKAVPIPGFPHTGNILGAGAADEFKVTIHGTEAQGGVPSQVVGVKTWLPKGTVLHPQGFTTCQPSVLENVGPSGCPKKSQASPVGSTIAVDPIGGEIVREEGTLQGFFAPGGQLQFYANDAAPISAQLIVSTGHYITAAPPYGPEFVAPVNLVNSVPGAPPVSTEGFNIKVGAAYKQGNKTVYYGRVPKTCPKGGFPLKVELMFLSGESASASYKAPCPKT
jgi:hypothetical protein